MKGHTGRVTDVKATEDGRYLLSASADGTLRMWALSGFFTEFLH
jgi:WD40 repeat protein